MLTPGRLLGHFRKQHPFQLSTGSLPGQVFIQWLGNPCEAFYESPVMAYKAKEGLNLHIGLWQCAFSNSFLVCITRSDTLFRYSMCQVVYLFLEETTLWWFQLKIILPKLIKHNTQLVKVFLHGPQGHD